MNEKLKESISQLNKSRFFKKKSKIKKSKYPMRITLFFLEIIPTSEEDFEWILWMYQKKQ